MYQVWIHDSVNIISSTRYSLRQIALLNYIWNSTLSYLVCLWDLFYFLKKFFCFQLLWYQLKFTVTTSTLIARTVLCSIDGMSENTFFNVSLIAVYVKVAHVIFVSFSFDTITKFKTKTYWTYFDKVISNFRNFFTKICTIPKKLFIFLPVVLL